MTITVKDLKEFLKDKKDEQLITSCEYGDLKIWSNVFEWTGKIIYFP